MIVFQGVAPITPSPVLVAKPVVSATQNRVYKGRRPITKREHNTGTF